jgi:carbonic anhydrase
VSPTNPRITPAKGIAPPASPTAHTFGTTGNLQHSTGHASTQLLDTEISEKETAMTAHVHKSIVAVLLLAGCATKPPGQDPAARWSYPEMTRTTNNWVVAGYDECAEPDESPIELRAEGTDRDEADVDLSWNELSVPVKRDAPTWEREHFTFGFIADAKPPARITVRNAIGSREWTLTEYHFHTPGEHPDFSSPTPTQYALEMHMKSTDSLGNAAVFAVRFMTVSTGNDAWFQPLLDSAEGVTRPLTVDLGAVLDLFEDRPFFAYTGSLTTPPCTRMGATQPIQWYVLQHPQAININSLNRWKTTMNRSFGVTTNWRDTHEIGNRKLTLVNASK